MNNLENIHKFILEHQKLLDQGNWVDFYKELKQYAFMGDVSYMLLESGIDVFSQPNGLPNIPSNYMRRCSDIKKFILPNNIERINDEAFYDCLNLEVVDLRGNNSLHSIGAQSFSRCIRLKEIYLPNSLKIISRSSFLVCNDIELIRYDGTMNDWDCKRPQFWMGLIARLKPGCRIIFNDGEYSVKRQDE